MSLLFHNIFAVNDELVVDVWQFKGIYFQVMFTSLVKRVDSKPATFNHQSLTLNPENDAFQVWNLLFQGADFQVNYVKTSGVYVFFTWAKTW